MAMPGRVYVLPMIWPQSILADLRRRLDAVTSQRHHAAPKIWGEAREWLETKGVQVVEGIETEKPGETAQRDR
jgi:hypothetical protein